MKKFLILALAVIVNAAGIMTSNAWADDHSPVGLWKSIDDETGKPKSLIRVTETAGVYQGKIEKLLRSPDQDQNPKCTKCEGAEKDQPILGMTIMTGLKKDDDEYKGGHILDPNNGKLYKCKMELIDGGKKLKVRGYIGFSLIGRSQIWMREE